MPPIEETTVQSRISVSRAMGANGNRLANAARGRSEAGRTYWLPSHVFVCQTQDCVVFLDARRDRYLGIGGTEAEVLKTLLGATTSQESYAGLNPPISSELTQVLDGLVARGLLTLESTSGRRLRQVDLQPGSAAMGPGAEFEHAPRLTHICAALSACTGAALDLRFRGVGGTLTRLLAQKQKNKRRGQASTANATDLRRLVGIFRIIRPFLYTKKDRCLFHGLALYRFLRHYGFSPTWVIGVSTAPFSAHCWVQYGEYVLDDSPKQTLLFTPVAAI